MASRCSRSLMRGPALLRGGGGGSGCSAGMFAGERKARQDHLSAAGRVPPSCASSRSDSTLHPMGGLLKGKLWTHTLPWARGEMSSLGLSLIPGWECRGTALLRGDAGPTGRSSARREGCGLGGAGGRRRGRGLATSAKPLPCPHLPVCIGLAPRAGHATTRDPPWLRQGPGLPRRCRPRGRCPWEAGAAVSGLRVPCARAAAPVWGHCTSPSTPPAAGLPALHAGDEGFHNPAQTGLKRNTQVNK